MKYFVTAWLRGEDDKDSIANYRGVMEQIVKKHGDIIGTIKETKTGRRLTISGSCEPTKGERTKDVVDRIAKEISEKINRVVKGKELKY